MSSISPVAVAGPPKPVNTALPLISGTARDGQALMTTAGSWVSNSPLSYSYSWSRCNSAGTSCVKVTTATTSSYPLTSADVNHVIKAVVTAKDSTGHTGMALAKPVGPVEAPPPPSLNSTAPVISGTTQSYDTLTTTNGVWSSPDTLTFSYQWERCDSTGASCTNIVGQNANFYTLTNDDVDHEIAVKVTATDMEGQTGQGDAMAVGPVTAGSPPTGIHKIQHVVIIMQENRSFDSYFGTYPGADGIPAGVCVPIPSTAAALLRTTPSMTSTGAALTQTRWRWRTSTAATWTGSSARPRRCLVAAPATARLAPRARRVRVST